MPSFSKYAIVLIRYPFSDLSSSKVRPAVVVNAAHRSHDLLIVPVTSRLTGLLAGECILHGWRAAGLNVASAIKRGLYIVEETLTLKHVGVLDTSDQTQLDQSLRAWLDLP